MDLSTAVTTIRREQTCRKRKNCDNNIPCYSCRYNVLREDLDTAINTVTTYVESVLDDRK